MKRLEHLIALALVTAGLSVLPVLTSPAQPAVPAAPAARDDGVRAMRAEADGAVAVSVERATRRVGFIRLQGRGDLMPSRAAATAPAAAAKARAYLDKYAASFGARPAELVQTGLERSEEGYTLTYTQEYRGVEVFGSMLRANIDEQGDLTAVNGFAAPGLSLAVTPRLSAEQATARAVGAVRDDPPGADGGADVRGLRASSHELVVYRLGSTKGEPGEAVLAYAVEVTNGSTVRDVVLLDAGTGKVVNRYSLAHDALVRELYEQQFAPANLVWEEGDAFPGALDADQRNTVLGAGETYWLFRNAFDRDSFDGAGARMISVNNRPADCPNASWNGTFTSYCSGVTSDDVVAHEWGHAYTEFTDGLIYQWQPGALNESYSDIWGETVDLVNGRMDDDEGLITAKRADGACSTHTNPRPVLVINSPAAIARTCSAAPASFGPPIIDPGTTGDIVLGLDDSTSGSTTDGCGPLTNAAAVSGNVALVDRGACAFTVKVKNAQDAGAIAVVVGQNNPFAPSGMGGGDPTITIPSLMISQANRNAIASTLAAGSPVNVTLREDPAVREDSYRWLMGEDSTAFGTAIRDMWSPTCLNDPGKVTDAEYHCDTSDGGGVHSNSGVPNHGYALLVDGGSYNGRSVVGIGLDKAAAIYYRAMTAYQTPTTDFADHADALSAACTDLVGQTVRRLTTTPNASPVLTTAVTTADCAQVAAMAAAVELRTPPAQCNFRPLLDKQTPALCGPGFKQNVVFAEDFSDGLAGWETEQEVVFAGGAGLPWVADGTAPGGHPGTVAYGPGPDEGDCSGGAGDLSSRDTVISPPIQLPAASQKSPRLSFDHYVATEVGYDGGNVKLSVNGGPYTVIPSGAYTFNPPGRLFTAAQGSTNPLAGQDGFTGTDGGEVTGSWGQSQIDLSAAGVAPGDIVRLRFDMGRDGCGGNDGWYVDNVLVSTCKTATKLTAVHQPEPVAFGTASRVKVTVERDGSAGEPPSGAVTLSDAAGEPVGQASLVEGVAFLALPADLPVGARTYTAKYLGNDTFAGATQPVLVTVTGSAGRTRTTTGLTLRPRPVGLGERWKAIVKVRSATGSPTGKVKLLVDGRKVAKRSLHDGRVRFVVTGLLRRGQHVVVAKYLGSASMAPSKDRARLRVVR